MAALAAILLPSILPAQIRFERTYGGSQNDGGYSVRQTTDGGYVIAGFTEPLGADYADVHLIKTDANGDTLWTMTFGGTRSDVASSVEQTTDGGYIIAGTTGSFASGSDVYLVKICADGDTLWTRTFGGASEDCGSSVQQTADSGYIIAGKTCSFGSGDADVYLIKTDADGDTLWTRTFGGDSGDFGSSVRQTADGGYIITGPTNSYGAGGWDVCLIKTDADGDTLWTKTYGDDSTESSYAIQQTSDGGFIMSGWTNSYGAGGWDVYLIKTDAQGDTLWTRTYGGADYEEGWSVQQTADSGYIIAGITTSFGAGYTDVYLIKADADGGAMWTRTFGGAYDDRGHSVQQTTDGGYIIVGYTGDMFFHDVYLIKTDSLGNVAVAEPKTSLSRASALSLTCEPNPCRGATRISLTPQASSSRPLTLRIYDAQGRVVRSFSSLLPAPSSLTWDGSDDLGQPLPSGAYFVRLDAGSEHATARVVRQR